MPRWLDKLLGRRPGERTLGERGENIAARYLRDQGYKIIVRNYRCGLGEVDIIARDGQTLVFVEVKTRTDSQPAPEEQVNPAKQHKLTKLARAYLGRYGTPRPSARFDVVSVVWPENDEPRIQHFQSAFPATF